MRRWETGGVCSDLLNAHGAFRELMAASRRNVSWPGWFWRSLVAELQQPFTCCPLMSISGGGGAEQVLGSDMLTPVFITC